MDNNLAEKLRELNCNPDSPELIDVGVAEQKIMTEIFHSNVVSNPAGLILFDGASELFATWDGHPFNLAKPLMGFTGGIDQNEGLYILSLTDNDFRYSNFAAVPQNRHMASTFYTSSGAVPFKLGFNAKKNCGDLKLSFNVYRGNESELTDKSRPEGTIYLRKSPETSVTYFPPLQASV